MLRWLIFMCDTNHNTEGTPNTEAGPPHRGHVTSSFTVRFWDYSRKPSNRTGSKSLKTLDRKISTREKFRFSLFALSSLFGTDVTSFDSDFASSPITSHQSPTRHWLCSRHSPLATRHYLFSTRVLRKESRKSSSINKTAKTSRHTFTWFPSRENTSRGEPAIA